MEQPQHESKCSGIGNGDGRHDAPPNNLSFGKDLGNPGLTSKYNRYALFQVLGKNGSENIGIRKRQIDNECMRSQETVITQRLKNYLSQWSKRFGFRQKVLFGNTLGSHAEFIGHFLSLKKDGRKSKELARAIFLYTIKQFFNKQKTLEISKALQPDPRYIAEYRDLLETTIRINESGYTTVSNS